MRYEDDVPAKVLSVRISEILCFKSLSCRVSCANH